MNYTTATIKLPMVREPRPTVKANMPKVAAEFCADMGKLAQESFQVLTLDGQNRIINRHMITLGADNASVVHGREVFRAAVSENAAAIIMLHNHPSGGITPSEADLTMTSKLQQAGEIMGIKVIDHIVLAGDQFYSMKEHGDLS